LISVEAARDDYGVWVDPETSALDEARTATLRTAERDGSARRSRRRAERSVDAQDGA
jgi:hypothetical protein